MKLKINPTAVALLISFGLILYYGSQRTLSPIIVFFLSMMVIYSFSKSRFIILISSCVISAVFFKLNQLNQSTESMSTKDVKITPVKPVAPTPVKPTPVKPTPVKPTPVKPTSAPAPTPDKPVKDEESFMPNLFGAGTLSESYENMEKQQKNLMHMVKMVQPMMKQTEALMSKIPPDMMKQAMNNMKSIMKKK